jgi:hypothetical protein
MTGNLDGLEAKGQTGKYSTKPHCKASKQGRTRTKHKLRERERERERERWEGGRERDRERNILKINQ